MWQESPCFLLCKCWTLAVCHSPGSPTSMSWDEFHPFLEQPKDRYRFVATASLESELLLRLVVEARGCSPPSLSALEIFPLGSQSLCYAVKHQEIWRRHKDKDPGAPWQPQMSFSLTANTNWQPGERRMTGLEWKTCSAVTDLSS